MKINTDLIYTGENFNIVFNDIESTTKAFEIAREILLANDMSCDAENLSVSVENNKIYLTQGSIGNYNDLVQKICVAIAKAIPSAEFYGHAFYDDDNCGYESCADYEYEKGLLKITVIESSEGHGLCPECEELVVCFDEYDAGEEYICEECGLKIVNHQEMFNGALPTKETIEIKIV